MAFSALHRITNCYSLYCRRLQKTAKFGVISRYVHILFEWVTHHHHHHHQSLNREGRWGTTDDFATSFLHLFLFSTALWDLPNSRPVHSLMLSSHLFLCPLDKHTGNIGRVLRFVIFYCYYCCCCVIVCVRACVRVCVRAFIRVYACARTVYARLKPTGDAIH